MGRSSSRDLVERRMRKSRADRVSRFISSNKGIVPVFREVVRGFVLNL